MGSDEFRQEFGRTSTKELEEGEIAELGPSDTTIIVDNLPPKTDALLLMDVFGQFGDIITVTVTITRSKKAQGLVRFERISSVTAALASITTTTTQKKAKAEEPEPSLTRSFSDPRLGTVRLGLLCGTENLLKELMEEGMPLRMKEDVETQTDAVYGSWTNGGETYVQGLVSSSIAATTAAQEEEEGEIKENGKEQHNKLDDVLTGFKIGGALYFPLLPYKATPSQLKKFITDLTSRKPSDSSSSSSHIRIKLTQREKTNSSFALVAFHDASEAHRALKKIRNPKKTANPVLFPGMAKELQVINIGPRLRDDDDSKDKDEQPIELIVRGLPRTVSLSSVLGLVDSFLNSGKGRKGKRSHVVGGVMERVKRKEEEGGESVVARVSLDGWESNVRAVFAMQEREVAVGEKGRFKLGVELDIGIGEE
ncbi:hypothetical protein HK102_012706 [Quaeritorhiza haematococci]|nr:hypothetical protein HK102_012706 [Quaeritorhiza haematococci]